MDNHIDIAEQTLKVLVDILNFNFNHTTDQFCDAHFAFHLTESYLDSGRKSIGLYLYPRININSIRLTLLNIVGTSVDCLYFYNEFCLDKYTNIPLHDPILLKKAVKVVECIVNKYVDYVNLALPTKIITKYECNHEIMK